MSIRQGNAEARDVIAVRGDLRLIQRRLLRRLFGPTFKPSPYSHGCVANRSIKTNAMKHVKNRFVYLTDIAAFYPSIHSQRVNAFFRENGCFGATASMLTTLTTLDHHLALGLITSPILAEAVVQAADFRIASACNKLGLTYTRYVDDICISSKFDLEKSGINATVRSILNQNGFRIQPAKDIFSSIERSCAVTGVRLGRGRISAVPDYVQRLRSAIDDASILANGGCTPIAFCTKEQLRGRIQFVHWLSKGQARDLFQNFRRINWKKYERESLQRGLVRAKVKFVLRSNLPNS